MAVNADLDRRLSFVNRILETHFCLENMPPKLTTAIPLLSDETRLYGNYLAQVKLAALFYK